MIVAGLLTWVGTSLTATGSFQSERNVENTATNAVNLAIQNTRYTFDYGTTNPLSSPANTPMLNNPTPELCATYTVPGATTLPPVDVYCTMVWQAYSANTRVFTYSACDNGATASELRRPAPAAGHRRLRRLSLRRRFAITGSEPVHAYFAANAWRA